jgi:thiol:disulfide interchange protein/DsbC/DsbD-like thiol-disulfide interchange protein
MAPGWHIYWKNSGASGIPTAVTWDLPAGITAGEIQWPVPEKLPPDDLTTYIYENEVVLLVPLKLAGDLSPGPRELRATVAWLECKEQCVPGKTEVSALLTLGSESRTSTNAALIREWQTKLPQPGQNLSAHAWWEAPAKDDLRPLIIEWNSPTASSEADFYPYGSPQFEVQGGIERLPSDAGKIRIRKPVKKFEGDWPGQVSGLLIQKSGNRRAAYEVTLPIAATGERASTVGALPGASSPASVAPAASQLSRPLWQMLLYAFIGGLILNVMPCVLPVIALKILGFVGEARNDPRHVRKLGIVYALGVLVSFLALAGVVIGVKAAGHKAGWGMQFSSPEFIVVLTVLVTLVALNLFGLFEVTLGGRVLDKAGGLASKQGAPGAFFNGVLATTLATPCTAPFLGVALGFAFAQSAALIVLMFLMVGLGLAFPYVLLSWEPAWLSFLPKPGPWMEKFKVAMGFPLLATALWLLNLASIYYGQRTWWLGIFLVIVALAAWVYGEFVQRGRAHRALAMLVLLALLAGGYAYVVEGQLEWRQPIQEARATSSLQENPEGIAWQPWSARGVAHAQEEGRPVLVDFTAAWCLTCQANKRIALEIPSVRAKLKQIGAVSFLGDYTRFPDDITQELNRYGRAGVPLVLVYPGKAGAPPIVLPELLTPGIVLNALDRVSSSP